jgi:hypothetical protein
VADSSTVRRAVERSLYFAFAVALACAFAFAVAMLFAVVFLVVIPEGDLLLPFPFGQDNHGASAPAATHLSLRIGDPA